MALLAFPAAAAAGSPSGGPAHAASKTATSILHTTVPAKGKYLVIVWVRSRGRHSRLVDVYLSGQPMRAVTANPWWGAAVYYVLNLSPTKLAVRTVNAPPAVQVRTTLTLRTSTAATAPTTTTTAPPPTSSTPSSSSSSPSSSSSTSTTTTTTTTPPPPPPPATDPWGPYTNLAWEDNFAQDYVSDGSRANQQPSSQYWNFDNWGGCGNNTLSTNTNSPANASLTSNGLAITALSSGGGRYTSAQVDTAGKISWGPGSTIEARIEMAAGQGLCPAFWMLSDNPPPNQGEIDVVEAPSFGATATEAWYTLHGPGPTSQQYESGELAAGSLANVWHNYTVTWGPASITWSMDGNVMATATQYSLVAGSSWATYASNGNYHLLIDLAVGGWPCYDNSVGPNCSPPASATMTVQWVKVFH